MILDEIAAKRQTIFKPAAGFGEELAEAIKRNPTVSNKIEMFKEFKKSIPPKRFPGEHKLSRKLSEFSECHLDRNILLYFIHKDDTVYLLSIDDHDVIRPGSSTKSFQQRLKKRKAELIPESEKLNS